ncbi:hypothetical protein MLD38_012476 [Melastoma candidum]|uniref:Uncharacterized protein n=1 Tax=Melastoma candidum TaxID=119954 RepID=A0ACB9R6K0_9MYRT|nr:hypothetical protein MLD38_012476 [Melastoma candidum]
MYVRKFQVLVVGASATHVKTANWVSILLAAKLAKPLPGTAWIITDSLYIKGDLLFMPVLYGKAILFYFVSVPEVRIGVAFGSGVSQTLKSQKSCITAHVAGLAEGKDLVVNDRNGRCEPYVKLHSGKDQQRTRTAPASYPLWNHKFEFDEIGGGEYLKVKDHNKAVLPTSSIGNCIAEYQRLPPNEQFDKWIPLQGVTEGEIQMIRRLESRIKEGNMTALFLSGQMNQVITIRRLESLIEEGNMKELVTVAG